MLIDVLAALALAAWLGVLLLTSGSWLTRERLEPHRDADGRRHSTDLSRVTVLIPARNEASAIESTLRALGQQGKSLEVIVIDDESDDRTAEIAAAAGGGLRPALDLTVIGGGPLPAGWGGKLWALEQGLRRVHRDYCLLLDAEIVLEPGMIEALLTKLQHDGRAMVSIMARLHCQGFWEKLLVPPFVFFFKLLYPFARVNAVGSRTAAAAGGCVLIRTKVLRDIGGFAAIRDALIDDCTLAARVKQDGHAIWLGLSESVTSTRAYAHFSSFRHMVTRTAFTQLRYSVAWLGFTVLLMGVVFLVPLAALGLSNQAWGRWAGASALLAMMLAFWPSVRFYRLNPAWVLTLPAAGALFLVLTVESAINYWRGLKALWKDRRYHAQT